MAVDTKAFQPGQTLDLHGAVTKRPGAYPAGGDLTGLWRVEKVLGIGDNAIVLSVRPQSGGAALAMKLAPFIDDVEQRMRREYAVQSSVHSAYVLRMWSAIWREEYGLLFMDQIEGGNLWSVLAAHYKVQRRWPLHFALRCMERALRALEAVHAVGCIHGDVKPENLLCTPEGVVLADFGLAQELRAMVPRALGAPAYMAPEVYAQQGYSVQSDVFAAGCMMQRLLGAREPFFAPKADMVFARLQKNDRDTPPEKVRQCLADVYSVPPAVADQLTALVTKMTALERTERPTAGQALALLMDVDTSSIPAEGS